MKVGELLATEGRQGFLRKYGDWVLLITVVVVVLGLLVFVDFRSTGRWQPFASIQQGITIVSRKIDNSINNQQRIRVLTERYDSLYRSVNVDVQLQRDLDRLLLENSRLRQVLGISEEIAYNNVVGEVIGRNPNDTYSFTINQGRERGIRVDFAGGYHTGRQDCPGWAGYCCIANIFCHRYHSYAAGAAAWQAFRQPVVGNNQRQRQERTNTEYEHYR